ncbi:MAG: hypothetical protein IIC50_25290 [Planctomycetes bacterium]|nr:hypothetical protein [Planctomycetota bacterium]
MKPNSRSKTMRIAFAVVGLVTAVLLSAARNADAGTWMHSLENGWARLG